VIDEPSTQILDGRRLRRRGDRVLTPTFTVLEGGAIGALHVLDPGRRAHRIGRAEDADVHIPAASVSRYHAVAVLATHEGEHDVRIDDNGSTNGIKVNGEPTRSAWLVSGDKVRLGDVLLRYQWMTDDEIQYASGLSSKLLQAARDPLTGLPTRAFVQDRLPGLVNAAEVRRRPIVCALVDLDRFKRINDAHGHLVGDAVIRRAARVMGRTLRGSDVAVRYGGEEFLVVFPDTELEDAVEASRRLGDALRTLDLADVVPGLTVTASQGVALRAAGEGIDAWIERADAALYLAKGQGRDRVEIADTPPAGPGQADTATQWATAESESESGAAATIDATDIDHEG